MDLNQPAPPPGRPPQAGAPRSHRRGIALQAILVVAATAVIWTGVLVHLDQARATVETEAARQCSNLADAAGQSIAGMIGGIDQLLLAARRIHQIDPQRLDFKGWIAKSALPDDARLAIASPPDPDPDPAGAAPEPAARQAARAQQRAVDDRLIIGKPVQDPATGAWSVAFSRPLKAPAGHASGAIVLTLDPAWLTRLYQDLDIGRGALMLVGTDGIVRARASGAPDTRASGAPDTRASGAPDTRASGAPDTRASGAPDTRASGAGEAVASGANAGVGTPRPSGFFALGAGAARSVAHGPSPLDGVDRFISLRPIPNYPLVVSVGLDPADVFAAYEREKRLDYWAAAVLTALLLSFRTMLILHNLRLLRSRQVLSDAVENIGQGLMLIDANHRLPLVNGRAMELLSLPPELLTGTPTLERVAAWQLRNKEYGLEEDSRYRALIDQRPPQAQPDDPQPDPHPAGLQPAEPPRVELRDSVYERTRPDGRVLEVRTRMLKDGGAVRTFTDITERRQAEAHVRHLAHHDALTGLANRVLLADRLNQALQHARRSGAAIGILALDLDRFKDVNDVLGHASGDALLVQVAQRLGANLRSTDTLARIGGDEFVILQTDAEQPAAAGELAQRLMQVLAAPFELAGHTVRIGSSIGIALHPGDGDAETALLTNADTALYRAKANGRGTLCFFEARMDLKLRQRRILEHDLRAAVGTDQFHLDFQPVFDAASRAITGFEALLRWNHPLRGDIPPHDFIRIAEESGLILAIGTWVLERACHAAMAWTTPLRLAVNLSAAQLRSGNLPAQLADILARTGLPADRLELEVTETLLITDPDQALATLRALRAMGVRIACDDFGTGYSSFGYLQNLAFDRIKIDRSFVGALAPQTSALRIVQAILAMARSLGMAVTGEGVETDQQLDILRDQGCDEVQGFLLGRPVAEALVQRRIDAATPYATDPINLLAAD